MGNRQITLAARPEGLPGPHDFHLVEREIPTPQAGEFLVKGLYLSVDPYMRGRMNDVPSYAPPVQLGEVMVGESVGRVMQSRHDGFAEGTYVAGLFGWQEFAVSNGAMVRKIDPQVAPISTALHVLGMPGMTAYFGLNDICRVKSGETLVVSGAAGAVGSTVGQLAKQRGCRVVGIAGSEEKLEFLTQLGFDAGFNYKSTDDYLTALDTNCPQGIDAYFDNVGGPITDSVFPLLNLGARIAICGQISQYNLTKASSGPRLLWHLIIKRALVQGFLVPDFAPRFPEALSHLTRLYVDGQLRYRERIAEGIENAPQAFIEMLQGANVGKQLVRLAAE